MRRDVLRSIRSCSRARTTSESGFALIWAVGLALLFFMLIELMLIDSARELKEARRFRSRMVAQILAENGAELAAVHIGERERETPSAEDWQGKITGELTRIPQSGNFLIVGTGETKGTEPAQARVDVEGVANGGVVTVNFTVHKP